MIVLLCESPSTIVDLQHYSSRVCEGNTVGLTETVTGLLGRMQRDDYPNSS